MGLLDYFSSKKAGPTITARVFVSGRIGPGWRSADRTYQLPEGATAADLLDAAERDGLEIRRALEESPHLRHTMMLSGERCPLEETRNRILRDGDELYLLGPIAGG